jgi:hypothetical protein
MAAPLIQSKFAVTKVPLTANHEEFSKLVDYNFLWQSGLKPLDEVAYLDSMRNSNIPFLKESMYRRDNTIMALFEKNKNTVDLKGKERIRWEMELPNTDLRATFVKNAENGNPTAGIRMTEFDIILNSNNFGLNDILAFDTFRDQPFLLKGEPFPEGIGYRYSAVLLTDDPTEYIELHKIPVGTRVSQMGSLIGEATTHRGNVNLQTGAACIEFETAFTRMGWRMKITDKAQQAMETYAFADASRLSKNGEKVLGEPVMLTNRAEAEFRAVIQEQKDLYLTWGKQTTRASQITDNITGNVLETGSGFYEFLNTSYVHEYIPDVDSLDVIIDQVIPLWTNKIPIGQRKIVIMSGTGGFMQWTKWAQEKDRFPHYEDDSWNKDRVKATTGDRVGVAINKSQIMKIFLEPFGTIEFVYAPWMDNDKNGGKTYRGLPASSWEFIVIDYGYGDGVDSNIYIATDSNYDQFGYGIGTWTPYGAALKGTSNVSSRFLNTLGSENAYELICETKFGFVMKDPSKLMRFIPVV